MQYYAYYSFLSFFSSPVFSVFSSFLSFLLSSLTPLLFSLLFIYPYVFDVQISQSPIKYQLCEAVPGISWDNYVSSPFVCWFICLFLVTVPYSPSVESNSDIEPVKVQLHMLVALFFHPLLHPVSFYQKTQQSSEPLAEFTALVHTGVWVTGEMNLGRESQAAVTSAVLVWLDFRMCPKFWLLCSQSLESGSTPSGLVPWFPGHLSASRSLRPYLTLGSPSWFMIRTHMRLWTVPPQKPILLLPLPSPQTQGSPYLLIPIQIKLEFIK